MKMDFKVLEVNVTYKLIPFAKLILMEWLWRVFHQHPNPDIRFLHILLAYYNMISFCGLGGRGHSARHSEMCLVSLPLQRGLQGMLMLRDTVLWAAQTWGSSHNRKRLRSKTIVCSRKSSYSGSHILHWWSSHKVKPCCRTAPHTEARKFDYLDSVGHSHFNWWARFLPSFVHDFPKPEQGWN